MCSIHKFDIAAYSRLRTGACCREAPIEVPFQQR
jgi:hypothetical protein